MKRLKFAFLALITISITSCSSLSSISNGGYSDVSLNKNSNEYELKRLNEISAEGEALFGIPFKAKKKKGVVVRFNGIDLGKTNKFFPIVTMVIYSGVTGMAVHSLITDEKIGIPVGVVSGVALGGILNNLTWSGAALQNASWNLNSRLVEENKDIDVFLNPKYEVEYSQGIFKQKAKVNLRVMGATIKTE